MHRKDPNQIWYWALVVLCIAGVLPIFFPGAIAPLILGVPLWVAVSLISTCILTVITLIQLLFHWSIAEPGSAVKRSLDNE